jgi:small subunit ribosomal protein S16
VAVKLRLMRMGKKKQPTYRVVAADVRSPRDGRFIEIVGTYDPRREPSDIRINNDKAVTWLTKGAQPTDVVRKLLKVSGAWEQYEADKPAKPAKPARAAKPAKKAAKAAKASKAAKKATKATKAAKASKAAKAGA